MLIFGRNKKIEKVYQDLEQLKKSYPNTDMNILTIGLSATGKSAKFPCIQYNQYKFISGQILIVKEMLAPSAVGGVIYDTEMELVEIHEKHIILQDRKGTSMLTGGAAEYCFSIEEIGKTIFPK